MRRRREFAHQGLPISEGSSSPTAVLSPPVCLLQHTKGHLKTISPPQTNTIPNRYFSGFPLFSPFIPVTSSSDKPSPYIPSGPAAGQFAAVPALGPVCLADSSTHAPACALPAPRNDFMPGLPQLTTSFPGYSRDASQTPSLPLSTTGLWPHSTRVLLENQRGGAGMMEAELPGSPGRRARCRSWHRSDAGCLRAQDFKGTSLSSRDAASSPPQRWLSHSLDSFQRFFFFFFKGS